MEQPRASFEFRLLDPRNRPYVDGTSDRISGQTEWFFLMFPLGIGAVLGIIFVLSGLDALTAGEGGRLIIPLLAGAGAAYFLYSSIGPLRDMRTLRRLMQEGKIVPGEIADVMIHEMGRRFGYMKSIIVKYNFKTPEGRPLTGGTSVMAPRDAPVPARGTPLAILYVDEKLHKAL